VNSDLRVKISRKDLFQISIGIGFTFLFAKCLPRSRESGKFLILSAGNRETFTAFLDSILPTGFQEEHTKALIIRRLDEELFFVDPSIAEDFRDALIFAEWFPLFSRHSPRWSRLSRLDVRDREHFILHCIQNEIGTIRAVYSNIRMVAYLLFYGMNFAWDAIGYDGPFAGFQEKPFEMRKYYQEITREL